MKVTSYIVPEGTQGVKWMDNMSHIILPCVISTVLLGTELHICAGRDSRFNVSA